MGATILSLRPFVKSLATNYGATTTDGYGSRYGDDTDDRYMQSASYRMHSFRPPAEGDEYKYRVWSSRNGGGSDGELSGVNNADADSMGSSESQRMIIQKNLLWEVRVEPK
jgi:hypothetical protein